MIAKLNMVAKLNEDFWKRLDCSDLDWRFSKVSLRQIGRYLFLRSPLHATVKTSRYR